MNNDGLALTPDDVKNIHMLGGSVLGTSRGPQDPREMVDRLGELGVSALFIIGGDGTLRGAAQIAEKPGRSLGAGAGITCTCRSVLPSQAANKLIQEAISGIPSSNPPDNPQVWLAISLRV